MAKGESELAERVARVQRVLEGHALGMHRLEPPASVLDAAFPSGLVAVYRAFNGASLFHESLVLRPSREVTSDDAGFFIAELGGDELMVAADGRVNRRDSDSGEFIFDGTSFDRWLAGWVDAEAALYDSSGEFLEDVIDDAGELLPNTVIQRERLVLRRDPKAPGPRFRLATALRRSDKWKEARAELEEVVANDEKFSWAWFALAQASEHFGDLENARDELDMAVNVDPDYPHNAYFLAHLARVQRLLGDKRNARESAARALELDPGLARSQREAAAASLDEGIEGRAEELIELALALGPTDLETLILAKKIRGE